MSHVKKNDTVVVLVGKYAGVRGKVQVVEPKKNHVTVEGVNVVKRHMKAQPARNLQGGIVEKTLPIDLSNVMLVCPKCGKPTRPMSQLDNEGKRVRVCRRCKEQF